MLQFIKCDESFLCHWFPSNSGNYSNTSLLAFVLNNVVFSKSSQTVYNETFKFFSSHVSLAAGEVSRKFMTIFK